MLHYYFKHYITLQIETLDHPTELRDLCPITHYLQR